jgi:hypothetical protein
MNERSAKPVPLFPVDFQSKCGRGAGAHFFDHRLHLGRHLVKTAELGLRGWQGFMEGAVNTGEAAADAL